MNLLSQKSQRSYILLSFFLVYGYFLYLLIGILTEILEYLRKHSIIFTKIKVNVDLYLFF